MKTIKLAAALAAVLTMHQASAADEGTFDTSFGIDGVARAAFDLGGDLDDFGNSQVDGPGGSTYVVGAADAGSQYTVAIAKLQPNGTLDPLYGDGGRAMLAVPGGVAPFYGSAPKAAMTLDGKLLVAFNVQDVPDSTGIAWVCRFTKSGAVDVSFGKSAGCRKIVAPWTDGAKANFITDLAVRADGNILVGGWFGSPDGVSKPGIASIMPDGKTMQSSFGTNGFVFPQDSSNGIDAVLFVREIELTPAGKLILSAGSADEPSLTTLVQLNANTGVVTPSFGDNGIVRTDFEGSEEQISIAADGKIYVTESTADLDVTIHRLTSNGTPDPQFAVGPVQGNILALQAMNDGVVASMIDGSSDDAVIRKFDASGKLDADFGDNGQTVLPGRPFVVDLGMQGDRVVGSGWANFVEHAPADFYTARFNHGKRGVFNVFPFANGNGSISPSTFQQVVRSDVAEFKLMPKPGFRVANVTGCGNNGELVGSRYRTGPISGTCVLQVTFEPIPFMP